MTSTKLQWKQQVQQYITQEAITATTANYTGSVDTTTHHHDNRNNTLRGKINSYTELYRKY